LAFLFACSVPFDTETAPAEITLNNTYGLTVEQVVGVPEEALREEVSYSKIVIHYTVTANNNFVSDVDVTLYVSDDTTADGSQAGDDETVLQETLSPGETTSGSTVSDKLEAVLNARQAEFVVGGDVSAVSLPADAEVTITMYAEIEGSYALSP
jgi:hypothetical protein